MEHNIAIEFYLRKVLNVKPGTRADVRLQGFFQGIVLYEQGYGAVSPSAHKKSYKSYLKYFERAIDKLSKKHPKLAANSDYLKERIEYMTSSDDMLWLYEEMKKLTEK